MIDTSRPVEPGNCWTRLLACNMLDPLLSRTFTPHSVCWCIIVKDSRYISVPQVAPLGFGLAIGPLFSVSHQNEIHREICKDQNGKRVTG